MTKIQNLKINKIIYAPQIENGLKQMQVTDAIFNLDVKLKIKHWESHDYIDIYPNLVNDELLKTIKKQNVISKLRLYDRVEILSHQINFMNVLNDVDLLITDQSSVIYECILAGIPTLVIDDWSHACGFCEGPQPSPDTIYSVNSNKITQAIEFISKNYEDAVKLTLKKRSNLFINLGNSTDLLLNTIFKVFENKKSTNLRINFVDNINFKYNSNPIDLNKILN